jgi:GNAT superfamily N-acetyltransferase
MTQLKSDGGLPVDLLCSHHRLDEFDCGNSPLNENLASRAGDAFSAYDPDEGMIVVAHEDQAVRGYLCLSDILIQLEPDGHDERCFYLAYFGVDRRWQGSDVAARLVDRAREVLRMRLNHKDYTAEVASTVFDTVDGRIGRMLERIGFTAVPGNSLLWYRRIRGTRSSP